MNIKSMKQNYCELKKNKIYAEIYDELLDEELNMNNPSHNDKIKHWLEKKINSSNYISISNNFSNRDDILEDVITKIVNGANNDNLQGNTLLMSADENSMYELFYMEDLTQPIPQDELNEFGSITNIFMQPVCWTCGIFKSSYKSDGKIYPDIITKSDVSKLFVQNFYHQGVMINSDSSMVEIEFTGENPFNLIGGNYSQSSTKDLFGFCLVPWVEKITNPTESELNEKASKILGAKTYGRVFFALVCPNTNKKFWNIRIKDLENILHVIENKETQEKIQTELDKSEININPFYLIKKYQK